MNNLSAYSIYISADTNYDSSFSPIEDTNPLILSETDRSKMYNHLISPNLLSAILEKVGVQKIFDSLINEEHFFDAWENSNDIKSSETTKYFPLSSMSESTPYPGLQIYNSALGVLSGECADKILNSSFSYPDSSVGMEGTMMVPTQLYNYLQASYCRNFKKATDGTVDTTQTRQELNDDVKSFFSLPVNTYSNFNHLSTEITNLADLTKSDYIASCSSIQSILKLIYAFLNNVYIYYPRSVSRKKYITGYLTTKGTYALRYYRGGDSAHRYASFNYVSLATPLVYQVLNDKSISTRYINLAKKASEKNIYNITQENPADFPELIELQANIASDEDAFNMQSTVGSNGSFQVTRKYEYSKVHPLDQFNLDMLYDMFDIRPEKVISFAKVYYAIKFLVDLWISNVSYFQVTTFICHSNCHLNSFSGAKSAKSSAIKVQLVYGFCTNAEEDLANNDLSYDTILESLFADQYYDIKNSSYIYSNKDDSKNTSVELSAIIPTDGMIISADIPGYTARNLTIADARVLSAHIAGGDIEYRTLDASQISVSDIKKYGTTVLNCRGNDETCNVSAYTVVIKKSITPPIDLVLSVRFSQRLTLPTLTLDVTSLGSLVWDEKKTTSTNHTITHVTTVGTTFSELNIPDPTPVNQDRPFVEWHNSSGNVVLADTTIQGDTRWTAQYGILITFSAINDVVTNAVFDSGRVVSVLGVRQGTKFSDIKTKIADNLDFKISGSFLNTTVSSGNNSLTVDATKYKFKGWSMNSDNKGSIDSNQPFTAARTIYATYDEDSSSTSGTITIPEQESGGGGTPSGDDEESGNDGE